MSPKEKAEELKRTLTLQGALSLAESSVKALNGGKQQWGLADLPDYARIANDVPIPESTKKELFKRERNKAKEVDQLKAYWTNVAGILRKQNKA